MMYLCIYLQILVLSAVLFVNQFGKSLYRVT